MSNYINKDSRHYIITKEGMQMFRQIEGGSPPSGHSECSERRLHLGPAITFPSDSLRLADPQRNSIREYAFVLSLIGVSMFLVYNLFTSSHIIFPSISAAWKNDCKCKFNIFRFNCYTSFNFISYHDKETFASNWV